MFETEGTGWNATILEGANKGLPPIILSRHRDPIQTVLAHSSMRRRREHSKYMAARGHLGSHKRLGSDSASWTAATASLGVLGLRDGAPAVIF